MTQATVSLSFTEAQLTAIEAALTALESQFTGLVGLTIPQRRSLTKMGDKSEGFCRQTLSLLRQNPRIVPSSLPVDEAQANLDALDQLRPLLQRIERLGERVSDTDMAVGAGVMAIALKGYATLKVSGKNQGLESLCEALGSRFARKPRSMQVKAA